MVGKRHEMTHAEWNILQQALPSERQGARCLQDRTAMNGIFPVLRTGIPWRDLPARRDPCTTCCNRRSRNGDLLAILERLPGRVDGDGDPDGDRAGSPQKRMIDSPAIRAHRPAAGSLAQGESPQPGRSRGGWSPGIHAVVDRNRQPRGPGPTPGPAADCTAAETLPPEIDAGMSVLADKAHDPNTILDPLAAVIPSSSNRAEPRVLDPAASVARDPVERFFARFRKLRRVAARDDRRARNLLSTVPLAAARSLMRGRARATI